MSAYDFSPIFRGRTIGDKPVFLIQFEIAAALLLGIGILWESDRYKGDEIKKLAFWLVMYGVIFETIFSVLLFASEERIGSLQRKTIIALEKRVLLRNIDAEVAARIIKKVKPLGPKPFDIGIVAFDDTLFVQELDTEVFPQCGWKHKGGMDFAAIPLLGGAKEIKFLFDSDKRADFEPAAVEFANALTAEGIPAKAEAIPHDIRLNPDNIHVIIGMR